MDIKKQKKNMIYKFYHKYETKEPTTKTFWTNYQKVNRISNATKL